MTTAPALSSATFPVPQSWIAAMKKTTASRRTTRAMNQKKDPTMTTIRPSSLMTSRAATGPAWTTSLSSLLHRPSAVVFPAGEAKSPSSAQDQVRGKGREKARGKGAITRARIQRTRHHYQNQSRERPKQAQASPPVPRPPPPLSCRPNHQRHLAQVVRPRTKFQLGCLPG